MTRRSLLCLLAGAAAASCGKPAPKEFASAYQVDRVSSGMRTMRLSPDARWGAAPDGAVIRVLDMGPSRSATTLEGSREGAGNLAFTPDDHYLVSGHLPHGNLDCDLMVWDLAAQKPRATRTIRQGLDSLAVSGDGKLAAAGCQDGVVRLFSLPDLEPRGELKTTSEWVKDVAFVPGGHRLAALGNDDTLALFDADGGPPLAKRSVPGALALAASPSLIAVAGKGAWLVDAATLRDVRELAGDVTAAGFSPDGEEVAFGTAGPAVLRYATRDGKPLPSLAGYLNVIDLSARPVAVAYFDQGNRLILAIQDGHVFIFTRR